MPTPHSLRNLGVPPCDYTKPSVCGQQAKQSGFDSVGEELIMREERSKRAAALPLATPLHEA
jgi:hypothetical protein